MKMKNILNFSSFINESVAYPSSVNLPENIIKHIESEVGRRALGQFTMDRNFGGMFLADDPKDPDLKILYINWENSTIEIPMYRFDLNSGTVSLKSFDSQEIAKLKSLISKLDPEGKQYFNYDPNFTIYVLDSLFTLLINKSRKESKFFNPFSDTDVYNNPMFKKLEKIGTSIISSELQKKKGTLVMRNDNWPNDVGIYTNGYIRSLGRSPAQLTNNPELASPLYDEENLNTKFTYLYFYTLKKILKEAGLSAKEIRNVLKTYAQNPGEYGAMAKDLVNKYPNLVLYLPPPEEGFDSDLSKGAGLLDKFGIFD